MEEEYTTKDGRDGRDGKDGINGRHGRDGKRGPAGPVGPTGPSGSLPDGFGLQDTSTHSYIDTYGAPGIPYRDGVDILNIINRAQLPITYIGIIWSTVDTSIRFNINIKDVANTTVQTLSLGPSPAANSKNVYEIYLKPPILTSFTRLLKFMISISPPTQTATIYSIMVGSN